MMQYRVCLVWCLLIPLFCACDSTHEIASNLTAKQSIELVVALNRNSVTASREQSGGGRNANYNVFVGLGNHIRALEIMHEYGLPRAIDDSLEQITRPRGFVPNTPQLAQLRFDHALELRVERAVLSFPDVIEARVVIQSTTPSGVFGRKKEVERGVSLVVRFLNAEAKTLAVLSQIQELVAKAVPGVDADAVDVRSVIARISVDGNKQDGLVQLRPFSFRVPRAERSVAGIQILVMFGAFCFFGSLLGIAWSTKMHSRQRRRMRTVIGNEGERSMFLEASLQENLRTKPSLPQVKDSGS